MANPTLPTLTEEQAAALGGTADSDHGTKVLYIDENRGPDSSPKIITALQQQIWQMLLLIAGPSQGQVIDVGGLNVGIRALRYTIGGVSKSYDGQATVAMTDDNDNYLYLDGSSSTTVQTSTSAFAAGSFHLAKVTCASGDITSIEDRRLENCQVNFATAWAANAATQDVDFDDNAAQNVKGLDVTDASELTISSGSITPTQFMHTVDTEGDAASDDLDTIATTAGKRQFLLLMPENTARAVTVLSSGGGGPNIYLNPNYGSYTMNNSNDFLLLYQQDDTDWVEVARYRDALSGFTVDVNANSYDLLNLGILDFWISSKSIASGTFALEHTWTQVNTEFSAATDDLDTVTGGVSGNLLLLQPVNTARTVVVKHAVGADKFLLANGNDFAMESTEHFLLCIHNGTQWREIARAPYECRDLIIASDSEHDAIPYTVGPIHIAGALSAADSVIEMYAVEDFTIKNATGRVVTAPSGGSCIVDVQVNTGGGFASIFASDGERIQIASGAYVDTSATKWHAISQGDVIRISVLSTGGSPNGAEDLTVMINGRAPMVDVEP